MLPARSSVIVYYACGTITSGGGGLGQARFGYANIYDILINGTYLFSRSDSTSSNGWYATNNPNDPNHPYRPYLFYPGNVVRDNWIFHDHHQQQLWLYQQP